MIDILKPVRAVAGAVMGRGERTPPHIAEQRLSVCLKCSELLRYTKQCRKCKCFVKEKVKYVEQKCPLKKWKI